LKKLFEGICFVRKLKLQVQISLDGFIAGPNGEMDRMTWNWDDALKRYVSELTASVDCIVLGRKLAQGFIPYWADVAADPTSPEVDAGKQFTALPKVVFTKTLARSEWSNAVLAKGDLAEEVNALKKQNGKDIIAYGGSAFVSALIKHDLIDEFNLFINPVALGAGMPIFANVGSPRGFVLELSKAFSCGIVLVKYRRAA
jgi:dihydrofolate reductase